MTTEKRVFDTRHEPFDLEFRWGGRNFTFHDDGWASGCHTEKRDCKGFEIEMVQVLLFCCLGEGDYRILPASKNCTPRSNMHMYSILYQGCGTSYRPPDISLHQSRYQIKSLGLMQVPGIVIDEILNFWCVPGYVIRRQG